MIMKKASFFAEWAYFENEWRQMLFIEGQENDLFQNAVLHQNEALLQIYKCMDKIL